VPMAVRAEPRVADIEIDWPPRGRKKHRLLKAVMLMAALGGVALVARRASWLSGVSVLGNSEVSNSMVRGSGDATIAATARQPGVRLRVDGEPAGALPVTLKNVTPGDHVLEFSIDNHYSTERQRVSVGPNEVHEVAPVSLKVIRGVATFRVRGDGATLTLVSGDERRVISDPSRPIEVDTERPLAVEISKAGHVLVRQSLAFESSADKTFELEVGPLDLGHGSVAVRTPESLPAAAPARRSMVSKAEWHPSSRASSIPRALSEELRAQSRTSRRARSSSGELQRELQFDTCGQPGVGWSCARLDAEGRRLSTGRTPHRRVRRGRRFAASHVQLYGRLDEDDCSAAQSVTL
jgi:hypothetical protein